MGANSSALQYRCVYNCVGAGHATCASKEGYDGWAAEEFQKACAAQDMAKIRELVNCTPALKDREMKFPGEHYKMTALAFALNRRDAKVVRELLDSGVSPNLQISEQQRSIYAHRSQLAALNGEDPDVQFLTPNSHFEALCCVQQKDYFKLLLEKGADPNSGIIQICYCGDVEMLEALIDRGAEVNSWRHESTPLVTSVKSKLQPYEKALLLLRASADPNYPPFNVSKGMAVAGSNTRSGSTLAFSSSMPAMPPRTFYPALTLATRKRDYRMVRILLEAGADVNRTVGAEGLPNVLFWATYWGELELVKLFINLSKHKLDLNVRKYTNETVFDVALTSKSFASSRKPRHIAKLPLPSRPATVYEKILRLLEDYRNQHPDTVAGGGASASRTLLAGLATGSTTATVGVSASDDTGLVSATSASADFAPATTPAAPAAPAAPAVPATTLAKTQPSCDKAG